MTELNFTNNQSVAIAPIAQRTPITPKDVSQFGYEASYLGVVDYCKAYLMQQELGSLAKFKNQMSVLGLQHPTVITLGHRANEMTELVLDASASHIPVVRSTRGGLATVHSEGQLVIYPILNLKFFNLGVRDYVYLLLQATQSLLASYGISAKINLKCAGVFTDHGKVAFCGLQVKEGITSHGLSLNVRNDLSLFQLIRSCGIQDMKMDSLSRYDIAETPEEIFNKWSQYFLDQFRSQYLN